MRITHHDHEVRVTLRARRGRRWIPSIEVQLADIRWEDAEIPHITHGWGMLVGFAVLGVVMHPVIIVGIYVFEGVEPTWLSMGLLAFVLLPSMAPLVWGLSKTRVVTRTRYRHRSHELRLSPAGVRLDGRPCEVWLAGNRMVTAEGALYEVAEDRDALRQLAALLAQAAPAQRERLGDRDDVPDPLRALLLGPRA